MATRIDENYQSVGLIVKDNTDQDIDVLKVDPVTGRLLVELFVESSSDLDVASKIDSNYEGVATAVTDDASADIKPLKVHPVSNCLLVDIG